MRTEGIYLEEGHLIAEEVAIAGTDPYGTPFLGEGIGVFYGASVEAAGVTIDDAVAAGVIVDEGSTADFEELVVRNTSIHEDWGGGVGIGVTPGGQATCQRCSLEGNAQGGAFAGGEGAELSLVDVEILTKVTVSSH